MEKNEQSRIADPDGSDIVVSPDDPNDPVVTTDDPNTCAFVTNTLKEIRAEQEKAPPPPPPPPRRKAISRVQRAYDGRAVERQAHPEVDRRNNIGSEISGEIEIKIKQLEKFLGISLKNIHEPVRKCCIYKVPKDLRKINKGAYTPQIISIGPFHRLDYKFDEMENQKLRYMIEFHNREEGAMKLEKFKKYIQDHEKDIRDYYQEESSFSGDSFSFINMILCDAVFIIEFFLKNANEERKQNKEFDFFLDTTCVKAAITRDLQLLENQLPYFLLKQLFEIGAFPNFTKEDYPDRDPFLILCHRFFFNSENDVFPEPNDQIQHFTDLRRYFLLMDFPPQDQKQGEHVRDLPTATKLHGSGVKFKKGNEGGSSLKISCEYVPRAMRIPGFKGCEIRIPFIKELRLQIPCFEIDDKSECIYRNMMALELCHYPSKTHICNFIVLMDFLINTEKDVDLFVEEGIIFSLLGDNAAVAKMFNNLGLQITPSFSVYHNIGEKLKAHYARPWNRTMANLNTVYFGDIWKGTATVAAIILLMLTFIQAVCSILSLL